MASVTIARAQPECRHTAIRSPVRGALLLGREPILGSAQIDDFAFYKLEWASQASPDSWSAVSTTRDQPVINGLLDEWDTSRLPDGRYRLRLVIVDPAGREVCISAVEDLTIANQPTPTVTASATVAAPDSAMQPPAGNEGESPPTSTPSPTATLAPILPRSAGSARPGLAIGELLSAGPLRELATDFFNGLLAAVVIVALALAIGRRRSP